MPSNPFDKPLIPKNARELLRWTFWEPLRVRAYQEALSKKAQRIAFMGAYGWFVLYFIPFWLLATAALAWWNLPSTLLDQYGLIFQLEWQRLTSFEERWVYLLKENGLGLVLGLALGLVGGFIYSLLFNLALSLTFGLAGGLGFGLMFGLMFGLILSSVLKFILGVTLGIAFGLTLGLILSLNFGLTFSLALGIVTCVLSSLAAGLAFSLLFLAYYFRLPIHPIYMLVILWQNRLDNNPYLYHQMLWLPLPGLRTALLAHTRKDPALAESFIRFLLDHRPLQRALASELTHAAKAARWQQQPFEADHLGPLQLPESEVVKRTLLFMPITDRLFTQNFAPSEAWLEALARLRETLLTYQWETNPNQKLDKLEIFAEALENFSAQNRLAPSHWNHYYTQALQQWAAETQERLNDLATKVAPIGRNPYRAGDPLLPATHRAVFMGREDLHNELVRRIQSAEQMPLFLFQGQRRVGKTSLLNFLPEILGERFKVVRLDAQSATDFPDIPGLWLRLGHKVAEALAETPPTLSAPPDNWMAGWAELENWLEATCQYRAYKLIIAIDEYEALQDNAFTNKPAEAGRLLGALRSFSQRQNQIVFLFTGAHFFFELTAPDWGRYFVQSVPLYVGYLSEADTLRLITQPTPDFPLSYAVGIPERIYALTQGHPTLTQEICRELFVRVGEARRTHVQPDDLEAVLESHLLPEHNHTLNVFWNEFCETAAMRTAVKAVIEGTSIEDGESLKKLIRHHFVLSDPNGSYRLCAPLFEQWVRRNVMAFES